MIAGRKPTQYTTVLKLMQIMAEKGLVRRDEKQRAHVYHAARPRASAWRAPLATLSRGGSA